MRRGTRSRRPSFTLLEVLLAVAISLILMGAVYVAVNVQLRQAQAGREVVEQSTIIRGIMARMDQDIMDSLGGPPPSTATQGQNSSSQGTSQASTGTTGTSTGTTGTSTGTTSGSTTTGSTSGTTSSSTGSSTTTTTTGTSYTPGVEGDSESLILTTSRVPREFTLGGNSNTSTTSLVGVSDLRRISYWLISNGDSSGGLARQEIQAVTSQDAQNALPGSLPNDASFVFAEQVQSLTFSYFDGNTWQDSWDSTTPGPDGVTPQGPPRAIAIVVGLATPGSADLQTYRHVVVIPTANYFQQNSTTTTTSSSTTGTTGP